jgi:GxxExxY protein
MNGWSEAQLNGLTEKVIGCAFKVSNTLGCRFLEKVYENALVHELRKNVVRCEPQWPMKVYHDDILVGDFAVDLLVEDVLLVELKATEEHHSEFVAGCLNYLEAAGKPLCLLLNFGKPRLDVKRFRGPN